MRVWLPDRPGALGQVASRIGAVHGDVIVIDILERGGGRVIDELSVALPESVSVDLLAKEVAPSTGSPWSTSGRVAGDRPDSATAVLLLAAEVAEAPPEGRISALVGGLQSAADGDWAVAVREYELIEQTGTPPDLGWLLAFLDGSGHLDPSSRRRTRPAT